MSGYINMNEFTKKEIAFIERVQKENIDITELSKRLKFLIKYCEISTALIIVSILAVIFIIGESPKIYHVLIFLSVFFVVLSKYLNWKHTLKFIRKNKGSLINPNGSQSDNGI